MLSPAFIQQNEIDLSALMLMSDKDFTEVGIPKVCVFFLYLDHAPFFFLKKKSFLGNVIIILLQAEILSYLQLL